MDLSYNLVGLSPKLIIYAHMQQQPQMVQIYKMFAHFSP